MKSDMLRVDREYGSMIRRTRNQLEISLNRRITLIELSKAIHSTRSMNINTLKKKLERGNNYYVI
jgi:plasmid maintenance system killer protein